MKDKFLLVGGTVLALPKGSLVCSDSVFWKEQTEEGSGESLRGRGVLFSFLGGGAWKVLGKGQRLRLSGGSGGWEETGPAPLPPANQGQEVGAAKS